MDDIKFPNDENPAQPVIPDEPAGPGSNTTSDGLARPKTATQQLPKGRPAPN